MSIGNNIKRLRKAANLTQDELAKLVGVGRTSITQWENDKQTPLMGSVQRLAGALNVSTSDIVATEPAPGTLLPVTDGPAPMRRAPIVGRIAAGDPREAIENPDGFQYVFTPEASEEAFYLVCAGDSMDRVIPQGMLVLVDPAKEARSGDVAAVMVNGDDATLKRVFFAGDTIVLHPESDNPEHRDRTIDSHDPDAPDFRVIGPVIGLCTAPGWRA